MIRGDKTRQAKFGDSQKRVFVTGLGVMTPIGTGHEDFWKQICQGVVGAAKVRAFDTKGFSSNQGGEITDFDPSEYMEKLKPEEVARTTQFAIAVARMAYKDAGLPDLSSLRTGICFGTTMGNQSIVEQANNEWLEGKRELSCSVSAYPHALIAAQVARELGTKGPALVFPTACAAGNYAIGWGMDLIRSGRADVVIAGGSDALSRGCYAVFNRLGAISKDVCRPFDRNRSGIMVSEGAAAIVLESEQHLRGRKATPYAELLSYGLSCDAHHPTAPHPEGMGAIASMQMALASAEMGADKISYINAHGTGTRANDLAESKAIKTVLGDRVDDVPISSIKSMIGHTMGAASAIEAVASVLAIRHRMLPPTANFAEPDPECLTNVVPNQAKDAEDIAFVLSNSFGFGGNISTVAFGVTRS